MRINTLILCLITLIAVFAVLFGVKPVPQDIAYHQFADNRTVFRIPNAFNVLSNIPFVLVGLAGVIFTGKLLKKKQSDSACIQYLVFFFGVFLTGLGSYYYHYNPSNSSLVWDRLPMTIAFMGLFCSVVSELINRKASAVLLIPLLIVGMGSVFYWDWTEKQGGGDLRFYALVQYLPMILIPLMLFMYKLPGNFLRYIIGLIGFYIIGKIFEHYDKEVFELSKFISGHTIKHLFSATGIYCVLKMLYKREDINDDLQ